MAGSAAQRRYTATAVGLHWAVALAIFGGFGLGLYMVDLPLSPTKLRLYSYHKWIGVSVFLLAVIRLAWRARHTPPAPPEDMPAWQQAAAQFLHRLLYALIIAVPLTGWLMSSAKGFQTVWFGVLPLPDLLDKDKALGDALALVHKTLNFTMATLVFAHIGAAFKHHFVDRDEVMARMLPILRNGKVTQ